MELIQEKKLKHWLDHFYGYGSWQAPIWFVAYEDSGGDLPEEVAERFNYFFDHHGKTKEPTLCNIREMYKNIASRIEGPRAELFNSLFDFRFGSNAVLHGIWKNLIAFVHGYRHKKLPDLLKYQQSSFVTPSSYEAWIQLYPLPSPHNHAWYYAWLDMPAFGFLKSRARYEQHVYQQRMTTLLQNIAAYQPEVMLMYDMRNINMLKKSVQDYFPKAKFKAVKGIKLKIPQHHVTVINKTQLIITTQTPALHHNRIETGFEWGELGKMLR
ncbi:MAG TPA: hypothetical protein DGG95_16460 [Cytophagales bacterium]|jgi:hypothetical protein|nr:hypothetical protein [Cytophagales bacterium]